MNYKYRYLVVGIFVVISVGITTFTWLWFQTSSRKEYNTYLAIFNEPVDGINPDSIIRYNGVEVGKVKGIELDRINPKNIYIYIYILATIPINEETYATIKPQGITGLSYIDLQLPIKTHNKKNLIPHNKPPYPIIETKPSFLYSISENTGTLLKNADAVSVQLKMLFNDTNIKHINNFLTNVDQVSTSIAEHSNMIGSSIVSMSEILNNMKQNANNLNTAVKGISDLTQSLSETAHNVNGLLKSIQTNTIQNINTILLPNLNQTIVNIDKLALQLDLLVNSINQNPSILIKGQKINKLGPGE